MPGFRGMTAAAVLAESHAYGLNVKTVAKWRKRDGADGAEGMRTG